MTFKIDKNTNVTVLTGAGISAESGLKTFRDANGLWENHHVEEVATPTAFRKQPDLVWKFYKQRYFQLQEVKPNPAHFALVRLEDFLEDRFHLITQNVDGLHFQAGNKKVIEMHGNLSTCFCTGCSASFSMSSVDLSPPVPKCPKCNAALRPDIVWFGEMPYFMEEIYKILENTDVFLVVGTSGMVYPAAQFLPIARKMGAYTVGVNFEPPMNHHLFDTFYQGKAGKMLPGLVEQWIQ